MGRAVCTPLLAIAHLTAQKHRQPRVSAPLQLCAASSRALHFTRSPEDCEMRIIFLPPFCRIRNEAARATLSCLRLTTEQADIPLCSPRVSCFSLTEAARVTQRRYPSLVDFGQTWCLFLDTFPYMCFLALSPSIMQSRPFPVPLGERLFRSAVTGSDWSVILPQRVSAIHATSSLVSPSQSLSLDSILPALQCPQVHLVQVKWSSHLLLPSLPLENPAQCLVWLSGSTSLPRQVFGLLNSRNEICT